MSKPEDLIALLRRSAAAPAPPPAAADEAPIAWRGVVLLDAGVA